MPFYMTQSKLSKDAIQELIAKPQDRRGQRGGCGAGGGRGGRNQRV